MRRSHPFSDQHPGEHTGQGLPIGAVNLFWMHIFHLSSTSARFSLMSICRHLCDDQLWFVRDVQVQSLFLRDQSRIVQDTRPNVVTQDRHQISSAGRILLILDPMKDEKPSEPASSGALTHHLSHKSDALLTALLGRLLKSNNIKNILCSILHCSCWQPCHSPNPAAHFQ